MKRLILLIACFTCQILVSGCADTRQSRLDVDYGTSHRLAIFNQIYNPAAEENLEPVTGLDPVAAGKVLDKYRNSFGEASQPSTYTINIGK